MEILSLNNICKNYGKSNNLEKVLKNINLSINKGDLIAIMGPSGSGKTTLLNILGLMDTQSSGNYTLFSNDISKNSEKQLALIRNQKIGFIFQNFNLINNYNLIENVILPISYSKNKKNKKTRALKALDDVGLLDFSKKKVNELSGGQKQRVAIARALINDPDIILADEPTGSLDVTTGERIMDILLSINQKGKTVVIITHDINIAKKCKKIIKLQDGTILS